MYFTSLVRFPRGVDPQMSVRRPGIELHGGRTNLNTNSARDAQNYSPVSPPDSPDLETYLQYINQEHRESNCVGGGDFNHS